nr:fad-linked oxidoreductase zeb1 [Quercus suber]
MREMASTGGIFNAIAQNVSHSKAAGATAVLPAWRDSLFHLNFGMSLTQNASWAELERVQRTVTNWQEQLSRITPGSGSYVNEAVFTDPTWKIDYYGPNYERLLDVKHRYDPKSIFWGVVSVGSDESWVPAADGRLCRVPYHSVL